MTEYRRGYKDAITDMLIVVDEEITHYRTYYPRGGKVSSQVLKVLKEKMSKRVSELKEVRLGKPISASWDFGVKDGAVTFFREDGSIVDE